MATMPKPFDGTTEQAAANYLTHHWSTFNDETECVLCVMKPWHVGASYPCGTEPPRIEVDDAYAEAHQRARFVLFTALTQSVDDLS
jgi:hypothetical protein